MMINNAAAHSYKKNLNTNGKRRGAKTRKNRQNAQKFESSYKMIFFRSFSFTVHTKFFFVHVRTLAYLSNTVSLDWTLIHMGQFEKKGKSSLQINTIYISIYFRMRLTPFVIHTFGIRQIEQNKKKKTREKKWRKTLTESNEESTAMITLKWTVKWQIKPNPERELSQSQSDTYLNAH